MTDKIYKNKINWDIVRAKNEGKLCKDLKLNVHSCKNWDGSYSSSYTDYLLTYNEVTNTFFIHYVPCDCIYKNTLIAVLKLCECPNDFLATVFNSKCTIDELEKYYNMVISPDPENYVLAYILYETKSKKT